MKRGEYQKISSVRNGKSKEGRSDKRLKGESRKAEGRRKN
jgi:hypothetical protein